MCLIKFCVLILFALCLDCDALSCHSEGGPKHEELKAMYINCLKKQDNKNSSNRGSFGDDDWRDPKGHNQRSQWDRGSNDRTGGRDDRTSGRNDRSGGRDDRMSGRDDRMGGREDRMGGRGERAGGRDDRMGGRDERMGGRDDRMGGRDDSMSGRDDRMGNRDVRMGNRDDRMLGREMMGRDDDRFGRSEISGREDFEQSNEYSSSDMPQYNTFRSSTQPSRRFKREKRIGMNSGQRSQYNPNSTQRPGYEDSYNNYERNSSENSSNKDLDKKACALHCLMENLEMTGDNGMPDRYLVTHAITKHVKNEDLKDFLQESIEECFQILDNENTEDKCEFSKNLLMCLSEKGRANCDDWSDDNIQF